MIAIFFLTTLNFAARKIDSRITGSIFAFITSIRDIGII